MTISARQCAVELLRTVLEEKRPLDEAWVRHPGMMQLPDRDRNFARLMVMTVLRRKGQIDTLLAGMLERPLLGKTQDVMHCLRLGVVQLIWLETPPHAAVHAMVETVAALGHERMKGVVNAVLKRVAQEGVAIAAAQDEALLNTPGWLYASWRAAYGEDTAYAIAKARLIESPLDITVKHNSAEWAEKLGGTVLPTGSVRIAQAGRVDKLPGFAQGAWWVQDAAAALPVQLLGDVHGLDVLDLCAAPGGKTAQLIAAGANVTAVDKSRRRLTLLNENLSRLQYGATMVESDILKYKPEKQFDAIVLDAPCSATGTLRRHPDLPWHKSADDVNELAALQRRLLAKVTRWLKPKGRLLYCVCSLQPEEGEIQARDFMADNPSYTVLPAPSSWKELHVVDTTTGALRTHPGLFSDIGGMDGFYAICWQA